jgi:ABC-type Fe3+ transport system permease subunit
LPILCLLIVSLHPVAGQDHSGDITSINYEKTLFFWRPDSISRATNGIYNSFIWLRGATIAMILSLVVSHMIHRTKGFGSRVLDFLCVVPIGFPGIVLAMGVLVTYIQTPIYATLWIILLGYITRFFPYGQRNVSSVMLAISEELDQSSRMAGASWFTTLRRITIPLLKPGIFAGWVLLFIIFLRELSISSSLLRDRDALGRVYYLVNFENEPLTVALSIAQTSCCSSASWSSGASPGERFDGVMVKALRRHADRDIQPLRRVQSLVKWFGNDRPWTTSRSASRAASS